MNAIIKHQTRTQGSARRHMKKAGEIKSRKESWKWWPIATGNKQFTFSRDFHFDLPLKGR